ncbi:unnamed protein product [Penicillium roqueforti FM164]|uniref:Genomic scaffold, ProqFM164S01 n=1 Tax=Penicillium roqueforti (strain FM164) TaxID=1365484 RepID=W6Q977_PENRF|nr:unnamed protein product [Penicillium roqueforti FM164]
MKFKLLVIPRGDIVHASCEEFAINPGSENDGSMQLAHETGVDWQLGLSSTDDKDADAHGSFEVVIDT